MATFGTLSIVSSAAGITNATLSTQATPETVRGGQLIDTATLSVPGIQPTPTGMVDFALYGPDDASCSKPPVFVSLDRPLGSTGTTTSEAFTPTAVGTYRWIASYRGDTNYPAQAGSCNDPNENSVVVFGETCRGQRATQVGTPGDDEITGTTERDVIVALGGNDTARGLGGDDLICGGSGRDKLSGGSGDDGLYGQGGRDRLNGKGGSDRLRGGKGPDNCDGGKRDDSLKGCEKEKSA